MNAARRARKRQREIEAGRHTAADHLPGQSCVACKPGTSTPDEKQLMVFMDEAASQQISTQLLQLHQRARSGQSVGRSIGKLARSALEAQEGIPVITTHRKGSQRGN